MTQSTVIQIPGLIDAITKFMQQHGLMDAKGVIIPNTDPRYPTYQVGLYAQLYQMIGDAIQTYNQANPNNQIDSQ